MFLTVPSNTRSSCFKDLGMHHHALHKSRSAELSAEHLQNICLTYPRPQVLSPAENDSPFPNLDVVIYVFLSSVSCTSDSGTVEPLL